MNVSVSTIGHMFSQPAAPASALSRPDAPKEAERFPLASEEPQAAADATRQPTSRDDSSDVRREPADDGRKDFDEVIRKKTRPDDTRQAPKSDKTTTEQDSKANTADQPDAVQSWLAQHSVVAEHAASATAGKIEPEAGRQPAQSIAETETAKSLPVAAEAEKSVGLELLLAAAKKQPAVKAAAPEMPANTTALNTQPEEGNKAAEMPMSNSTVADTKGFVKEAHAKELMPEVPVDTGAQTTTSSKPAITETLAAAQKAPSSNTKDLTAEASVDGSVKSTDAGDRTATAADMPATAPVKAPEKPLPTAEIEADAGTAETLSKTPNLDARHPAQNSNDLANASSGTKLNAAAIQTPTGQTDAGDGSGTNGNLNSGSEQILSQTPLESPVADQASAFTVDAGKTVNQPEPTLSVDSSPGVGEQILESVRSSLSQQSGDKQITIQLNPPELGKVSVKFQEQGAQLTGILEVSKAQTRLEIEQALPQIIRSLADSGVEIRRIEVVLNEGEQSSQQAFKDPRPRDGSFAQHNSADSGASDNERDAAGTGSYYGPTGKGGYQGTAELQDMLVRDDSINILV